MKKTVGVITMHRIINYGSFLQAYATQCLIEKLGYSCEIIDYQYPNTRHISQSKKRKSLRSIVAFVLGCFLLTPTSRKKKKIFDIVFSKLNLSKIYYKNAERLISIPPIYDIYITGSDQTLNPKHIKGDSMFLLSFAHETAKRVAFSASLSVSNIEDKYQDVYKKYLSKYSSISLREYSGVSPIKTLTGITPSVTLDPTLLLTKEEWLESFPKNRYKGEKFILFYLISHSFDSTPYIYELLQYLQKETGLVIYSFSKIDLKYNLRYKNLYESGIDDFISLFANATSVVTSSFHGTAFSVNFGVPLYSVVPRSVNDTRQVDLLKAVSLEESIVYIGDEFREVDKTVDKMKMNFLREDSISTLNTMLKD